MYHISPNVASPTRADEDDEFVFDSQSSQFQIILKKLIGHYHPLKSIVWRFSIVVVVLVLFICTISFLLLSSSTAAANSRSSAYSSQIKLEQLWRGAADSGDWRSSSVPRSHWPPPPAPSESNGYLLVRCNGGLNQQRIGIVNSVLVARIMNATLVLPKLGTNSFWHDNRTMRSDVQIVKSIQEICKKGKTKKNKAFQIKPKSDDPISWYTTVALEKMKEHGAIYLTPFSHRLAEEIDNPGYQRLRCRVNYDALRFKPHIMKLSQSIVDKLRSQAPPAPSESNGYLLVRCNGGLNQQRIGIVNSVLIARIMNATLVLPKMGTNSFWHDNSGFHDIWYTTVALEKMKEHGAIYLTPFSHRLAEEIDNPGYQRLRCRVNYDALRFKPHIMKLSQSIVDKLRSQGQFMSIHLRFEMDMLAFAGYVSNFIISFADLYLLVHVKGGWGLDTY
nr:uncharacterized protein CFP56_68388 [Quercus suber]